MLTIEKIQQLDASRFLVNIDRNTIVRSYVFTTRPPADDGVIDVSPPEAFLVDMAGYAPAEKLRDPDAPPPVLQVPCDLVRKLARGEEVSLPVVLDER